MGLPSTTILLAQRFKQQKEIDSNGLNNIQDRSIYEDVEIFARNLYDNEKMTKGII